MFVAGFAFFVILFLVGLVCAIFMAILEKAAPGSGEAIKAILGLIVLCCVVLFVGKCSCDVYSSYQKTKTWDEEAKHGVYHEWSELNK